MIEREPKEITEIASRINTSYANTKKHIDQLVHIGLVQKEAGFGRETVKGSTRFGSSPLPKAASRRLLKISGFSPG